MFVPGYLLVYFFALKLDWFPVRGYRPLREGLGHAASSCCCRRSICPSLSGADRLRHPRQRAAARPGTTCTPPALRAARGALNQALAVNAAVPIVTVIGIGIALLIGGVVVTESVYSIPRPRHAHGRCHCAGARLSGHPGRDPVLCVSAARWSICWWICRTCSLIRGFATDEERERRFNRRCFVMAPCASGAIVLAVR